MKKQQKIEQVIAQRGFTLLEVLVVIGVIAIFSSVFFSNWANLQTRPNLDSAMRQIEDVVLSSRTDVLALTNSSYRINLANGVLTLSQQAALVAACSGAGAWVTVRSYTLNGVTVVGPQDLCFNSDGSILSGVPNAPIQYLITRGANERAFRLTLWPTSGAWQREERTNASSNWVLAR